MNPAGPLRRPGANDMRWCVMFYDPSSGPAPLVEWYETEPEATRVAEGLATDADKGATAYVLKLARQS